MISSFSGFICPCQCPCSCPLSPCPLPGIFTMTVSSLMDSLEVFGITIPCSIDIEPNTKTRIWVGSQEHPTRTPSDSWVLAFPGPEGRPHLAASTALVLTGCTSESMDAALSMSRRLSIKFNRPIYLSIPARPLAQMDESVFLHLEKAIRGLLTRVLAKDNPKSNV